MAVQKCDVLTEALIDSLEKWRVEDPNLVNRIRAHRDERRHRWPTTVVGGYLSHRRFIERYLKFRRHCRVSSKSATVEVTFMDQLSKDISETAFQYFMQCLNSSHEQKLIFALWTEGMCAAHIAELLDRSIPELEATIVDLKARIKQGVTGGV